MKNAFLGLAIGIVAFAALAMNGGIGGGGTAQAQDPDYSGIGDEVDFSGLEALTNMAPVPIEEPDASEPPAAAVEEPMPAVVNVAPVPVVDSVEDPVPVPAAAIAAPVPVAPATSGGVAALPATGAGVEGEAAAAAELWLFAAGLAVMGTLIVAAAKRRA